VGDIFFKFEEQMMDGWRRISRSVLGAVWLVIFLAVSMPGSAQTVVKPSLQQLHGAPAFGYAALSPNGRYLGVTANKGGVMNLAVVDLQTNQTEIIAGATGNDVAYFWWVTDERLVYVLSDRSGKWLTDQSGFYGVNRDGSKGTVLMPPPTSAEQFYERPYSVMVAGRIKDRPNSLNVVGRLVNGDVKPYEIDVVTGRLREISYSLPGRPFQFAFDHTGALRAVVTAESWTGKQMTINWRESAQAPWQQGLSFDGVPGDVQLVGYSPDNKTLYVIAPNVKGKGALYELAADGKSLGKQLASDDVVDISAHHVMTDPTSRAILGVRIPSDPPRTEWLTPDWQRLQASIDRALPGAANLIIPGGTTDAAKTHLITSYSSTNPSQYLVFRTADRKLQPLLRARPDLSAEQLSVQQVFDYTARDKTPLMAYLTLPRGSEPKALPLVVLVHGGPWGRDLWGFNPEVQHLASLGYAVLQPQFRGSSGFGSAFMKLSKGEFGRAMQHDLDDGVKALAAQGVVDAKRVCYMGASYGGYAAMVAATRDASRGEVKCAINLFGPTDMDLLYTSGDIPQVPSAMHFITNMAGNPATDAAAFAAASPARHAEKITAPVLMIYGAQDQRVPLVHAQRMRAAMDKAGKPYEYIELDNEGHGINLEANRFKVYGAVEKFLQKHNPVR
jgi:dipeptidyl aminopeptidase/acylaminoacyl peptidase